MIILQTLEGVLVFAVTTFGLGAACAPTRVGGAVLRLATGTAMGIGGLFVVGFLGFAAGLPNRPTAIAVAVAAAVVIVLRRRTAGALLADANVVRFLGHWLLFVAWSLGLLALVASYSGGGWAVDWIEHWQRTVFFLERQPLDTRFGGVYSLTARPPLVNLLIALWLEATGPSFAFFQVFMTLFGSLVLLPCWTLAERWGGAKTSVGWWLVLALLANPMVAQNLTFAWTKLPTAFFILVATCLCLEGMRAKNGPALNSAALCLGLAVLAHYSACPWVIALGLGFLIAQRRQWRRPDFRRDGVILFVLLAILPTLWVGWAASRYGSRKTMGGNTTAEAWHGQSTVEHITTPLLNLYDTLVPFLVRGEPNDGLILQESKLGRLRDVAFSVYQVNLPFAFGFGGIWVLAALLDKRSRDGQRGTSAQAVPPADREGTGVDDPGYNRPNQPVESSAAAAGRAFWWSVVPLIIVLGIVVHTPRDEWGLVHICLQPLVLIGLARIAAGLAAAPVSTRVIWAALAAVDFLTGIALHFGLESGWLARFVAPNEPINGFIRRLSMAAMANARNKATLHLEFFADRLNAPAGMVALLLAALLLLVLVRLNKVAAT